MTGELTEVGSSSRRMEGLISSSWPMEARLRSPPDIPLRKKPPGLQDKLTDEKLVRLHMTSMHIPGMGHLAEMVTPYCSLGGSVDAYVKTPDC